MSTWTKDELGKLTALDRQRHDYLINLREISAHDRTVRPDRGNISVECFDQITISGAFERPLRDTPTGRITAHEYVSAPIGADSTLQSTRVAIAYHVVDWPHEDICGFCRKIVNTLEDLVNRAYQLHP